MNDRIVGFAIVDVLKKNVWALFVHPDYEKKGIGRQLHDVMLNWYFTNGNDFLWLCTAPQTRAEAFYKKAGWHCVGLMENGELKFEMQQKQISDLR